MGKQSDTHISAVNAELGKLKTAVSDMDAAGDSYCKRWQVLMNNYNQKKPDPQAGFSLKQDLDRQQAALAKARTAVHDCQNALFAFERFLVDKEASTINPLAKKSLGSCKRFVADTKDEVRKIADKLKSPDVTDSLKVAQDHLKNLK